MSRMIALREVLARHSRPAASELVRREGDRLRCLACGHRCAMKDGGSGKCRVRFRVGDEIRSPWGYVAGLQVDPIEKKPFYHVHPGRTALSFGMLGCNFHCSFCQNWISSQVLKDDQAVATPTPIEPADLVRIAVERGAPAIVSTYNEPLITSDWAVDVFRLAKAEGLTCGYVSNGHASAEVLAFLRPWLDLFKVDLKTFHEDAYRGLGGVLDRVKETIAALVGSGTWVEVVTLVVPGFNDDPLELRAIASFLADISPDIPWHVTAFHPSYRMTGGGRHRTPPSTLERAHAIGLEEGLRYVYAGNRPGSVGDRENTRCPSCGATVVERMGYVVKAVKLRAGSCPTCGESIPGIWR